VDFWASKKGASSAASVVADALHPLKKSLDTLSTPSTTFPAASDESESIYSSLLVTWDASVAPGTPPSYPTRRMRHLLHLVTGAIISFARSKLAFTSTTSSGPGSLWALQSLSDIAAAESDVSMAVDLLRTWRDHHLTQLMRDWMPGPACISRYATVCGGAFPACLISC
jgi:hypothetical protein